MDHGSVVQQIAVPFRSKTAYSVMIIHAEYFTYLQWNQLNMNIITEYAVFEQKRNPLYPAWL